MPSSRGADAARPLGLALLGGLVGCANEGPPPGSFPDFTPPEVAEISPAADTVIPGFGGGLKVKFSEPVNLGGDFGRRVIASPAELYDVGTGFSELEIRPKGGWRDGVVYCFELPAGITDLMRNRTEAPIGFCFSTGPEVTETLVNGRLTDRVTGQPVRGGRVLFLGPQEDTVRYSAVSDSDGEFRLGALPPGDYWAYGFQDNNRNFSVDRTLEAYDSATVTLRGPTSTVTLDLSIVEPDSTPPILVAAEAVDSLSLRLEFDDPLLLEQDALAVAVRDSATGREIEVVSSEVGEPSDLLSPPEPSGEPSDSVGAAPDSARAAPDSLVSPAPRDPLPVVGTPQGTDEERRPSRTVTVRLAEPLWEATFIVVARSVRNLRELTGDSETSFVYVAPEPEVPPDPPGPPRSAGRSGASNGG